MALTQLKPPGNSQQQSNSGGTNGNFAKALLEAGGHVAQSTVDTGVQMASDALASLFGAGSGSSLPTQQQSDGQSPFTPSSERQDTPFNMEQKEAEWKQHELHMIRHREIQQMEVYNARQVQTDRKIEQLLSELQALAKDLDKANREAREAQIAVMQGAVSGGDYHVTFFEHLLKVLVLLRKRVKESTTWLQAFNARGKAKKGYWAQFASQGTQWAMSGERSIATSVG